MLPALFSHSFLPSFYVPFKLSTFASIFATLYSYSLSLLSLYCLRALWSFHVLLLPLNSVFLSLFFILCVLECVVNGDSLGYVYMCSRVYCYTSHQFLYQAFFSKTNGSLWWNIKVFHRASHLDLKIIVPVTPLLKVGEFTWLSWALCFLLYSLSYLLSFLKCRGSIFRCCSLSWIQNPTVNWTWSSQTNNSYRQVARWS